MSYIHINAPRSTEKSLFKAWCFTCGKKRFYVAWFAPYYGYDKTCLGCGERHQDGEQLDRPFVRGWRKKSIDDARKRWRA